MRGHISHLTSPLNAFDRAETGRMRHARCLLLIDFIEGDCSDVESLCVEHPQPPWMGAAYGEQQRCSDTNNDTRTWYDPQLPDPWIGERAVIFLSSKPILIDAGKRAGTKGRRVKRVRGASLGWMESRPGLEQDQSREAEGGQEQRGRGVTGTDQLHPHRAFIAAHSTAHLTKTSFAGQRHSP